MLENNFKSESDSLQNMGSFDGEKVRLYFLFTLINQESIFFTPDGELVYISHHKAQFYLPTKQVRSEIFICKDMQIVEKLVIFK